MSEPLGPVGVAPLAGGAAIGQPAAIAGGLEAAGPEHAPQDAVGQVGGIARHGGQRFPAGRRLSSSATSTSSALGPRGPALARPREVERWAG